MMFGYFSKVARLIVYDVLTKQERMFIHAKHKTNTKKNYETDTEMHSCYYRINDDFFCNNDKYASCRRKSSKGIAYKS